MEPLRPRAGFWRAGHLGTLLTALFYFDVCFAVWVLNGAMAPYLAAELHLSSAQKGLVVSLPVVAGALFRLPLGMLAQAIGRKKVAQLMMGTLVLGLLVGWQLTTSLAGVLAMGVLLGVAGASFGVAMSLGSGWYPPRYKGLAMGIAGAGNSGALIAVLGAPPLAEAYGWRAVYGLAALPVILAMVLLQIFAKEPPDREQKRLRDYAAILVDRDAWVLNLIYMVTFGGYIGLTSFLPTLFHDQYGVPRAEVGPYVAGAIFAASALRVAGGWLADRIGGIRLLFTALAIIGACGAAAATVPSDPAVMVAILVIAFAAMGAGNGAVFQLVPLRFPAMTAVAGSLVGEIGALAGGFLPNALALGNTWTGSYGPGFATIAVLTGIGVTALSLVITRWTTTWIGADGRAAAAAAVPAPVLGGANRPTATDAPG